MLSKLILTIKRALSLVEPVNVLDLKDVQHIIKEYKTKGYDDVSSEEVREYSFPNGEELIIFNPLVIKEFDNDHTIISYSPIFDSFVCYHIRPEDSWSVCWTVRKGMYPVNN